MRRALAIGGSLALLVGCSSSPYARTQHLLAATAWFQMAGESYALQYQAYRTARYALDEKLKHKPKGLPLAVVVDVDETALSNGPAQVNFVLSGQPYPYQWEEWIQKASAKALRGAVDFLVYANSKKVGIFYVTNRNERHKANTIKNLTDAGFPDVSETTVLCSKKDWDKESRRKLIREKYQIALLIGDNLNDFSSDFSGSSIPARNSAVDAQREKFGTSYIVVPNPMYGDWESAAYGGNYALPDAERERAMRDSLR